MTSRRPEWLDQVLGYDDLSVEERAEVDALLAENEDARNLLRRIRAVESASGPHGELPVLESIENELDDADRVAAERSLEQLRRRVEPERAASATGTGSEAGTGRAVPRSWLEWLRGLLVPRVLVPVAAAATILLLLRLPAGERSPLLGEFDAWPAARMRGAETTAGAEGWSAGEAFVLRCEIRRPAVLVLVHVDPEGRVTRLAPKDGSPSPHAAGLVEFPRPGEEWVLDDRSGTETFLLAAEESEADEVDLSATVRAIAEVRGNAAPDRVVAEITRLLEKRFGEVRVATIEHSARPGSR